MTLYWSKKALLFKIESEEGVDAEPAASQNAILAVNVQLTPMQGQEAARNLDRPYFGAQPTVLYGRYSTLQFQVEMAGSGGKTTAPAWGPLVRVCGLAQTTINTAAGTIAAAAEAVGEAAGKFTYTRTTKYTGNAPRTVTLECTKAGGSGIAEFKVSAPAVGDQEAYLEEEELMTDAQAFDLGGGAQITPTVQSAFELGDTFTIDLMPERTSYTPVSGGIESGTLYLNIDGILHKMFGCRGNLGWTVQNGIPYLNFTLNGTCEPVSAAELPTPDFSAFKEPLVAEVRNTPLFSLHGKELVISQFTGDLGNVITPKIRVNQESIPVEDRNASGSVLFDMHPIEDKNWFEIADTKQLGKLLFQHGRSTGKIVGIRSPGNSVEIRQPTYRQDGNTLQLECGLGFIPTDAGNDELEIWTC